MTYSPKNFVYKQQVGKVLNLYISKKETSVLELDEKGVIGDKHYNKDINRSVLIASVDSYEIVKNNNIKIEYGSLGENILLDFNPYSLEIGTKIAISDTILEISQNCTLCKSLSAIDSKVPKLLKNDRGIFAKVIKKGKINKEDKVYVLK